VARPVTRCRVSRRQLDGEMGVAGAHGEDGVVGGGLFLMGFREGSLLLCAGEEPVGAVAAGSADQGGLEEHRLGRRSQSGQASIASPVSARRMPVPLGFARDFGRTLCALNPHFRRHRLLRREPGTESLHQFPQGGVFTVFERNP
jgi:hypothetical protein